MFTLLALAEGCIDTKPHKVRTALALAHLPIPLISHDDPDTLAGFARCLGLQDNHVWAVVDQNGRARHESAAWCRTRETAVAGMPQARYFRALAMTGMQQQGVLVTASGRRLETRVTVGWQPPSDPRTDLSLTASLCCDHETFTLDLRDYFSAAGARQRAHFRAKEARLTTWWEANKGRNWPASALDHLCDTAGPILDAFLAMGFTARCVIGPDSPNAPLIAAATNYLKQHVFAQVGDYGLLDSPEAADEWLKGYTSPVTATVCTDDWAYLKDILSSNGISIDVAATAPLWPSTLGDMVAGQARRVASGATPPLHPPFRQPGVSECGHYRLHLFSHQGAEQVVNFAFGAPDDAHSAARALDAAGWAVVAGGRDGMRQLHIETGGAADDPEFRAAWAADLHLLVTASADRELTGGPRGFKLTGQPGFGFDRQGRLIHTEHASIVVEAPSSTVVLLASWFSGCKRLTGLNRLFNFTPRLCAAYMANPHRRLEHLYDELMPLCARLEARYGTHSDTLPADDPRWEDVAERVTALRHAARCDGAAGHGTGCAGEPLHTATVLRLLYPALDAAASIAARGLACDCALGA